MANITGFSTTYAYDLSGTFGIPPTINHIVSAKIPFYPSDAVYDFEITSSNQAVAEPFSSATISAVSVNNGVATVRLAFYTAVTGNTVLTFSDKITGLQTQRILYNNPIGVSPNIYPNPSAVTLPADYSVYNPEGLVELMPKISEHVSTGCSISSALYTGSLLVESAWTGNDSPAIFGNESGGTWDILLASLEENSGETRWVDYQYTPVDTGYNSYYTVFRLIQEGSGTTPSDRFIRFVDTAITLTGSYVSAALEVSGCTSTSDYRAYTGSGAIDFTVIYQFYDTCTINANPNTGSTQIESDLRVEFMDTDGNVYYDTIHVIQPVSTPLDSYIRFVDSAVTAQGNTGQIECPLDTSGCTAETGIMSFSATGTLNVTGVTVNLSPRYQSMVCTVRYSNNTGSTPLQADVRVEFVDTSGNTYYDTIHITQEIQVDVNFNPSTHEIQGQANRVTSTAVPLNCTISSITFSDIQYTYGTWDEYPVYTINGNDVTFAVPANNTNNYRVIMYRFTITDTDGNTYTKNITVVQMVQNRLVYLDPTGRTISVSGNGTYDFNIKGSGCSIDSSYTPTFTFSGDTSWINSISSVTFNDSEGRWYVSYYSPRNLGGSGREVYITVDGVHDTDGNVYNGLVHKATQNYGSYVFLNYDEDHNAPSGSSVETVEVVPVNTTVCSISVTSASSTPDLWTGVTKPTVTVLGNYITVNWPQNPHTSERNLQLTVEVVWGESCENTTTLTFNKYQNGAQTPVQKDIEAEDTDYSVGSGSGNGSTTVQASGCTYDHFTYVTGGSFSVTATSGPNNTILFYYPENPTTSPRTGYAYITFFDSDGNTYGPQTISFTQQAGSSPGPGPGPDPSTGYVLTTLTISDQEQHRYFVEARPGVVYSAAGQYYKTILACEARYSLYYVNSYGGVDVLPFKEKGWKKSDTITRFNYSRSFRNNTPEFENVNYMNEIKVSWELHTGWLSDEQSKRMHELVESTIVYLYDAEEKTYTPVVMTDKKLEYKTYHNQGKKFYNYTVNVEESQSKERR